MFPWNINNIFDYFSFTFVSPESFQFQEHVLELSYTGKIKSFISISIINQEGIDYPKIAESSELLSSWAIFGVRHLKDNSKYVSFLFFSAHLFSRNFVNPNFISQCQKIIRYEWICSRATSNIIFRSKHLEPLRLENHLGNTAWDSSDGNLTVRFSSSWSRLQISFYAILDVYLCKSKKKIWFWILGHI